jgi:serine/threonine-protein kinase
MTEALSAILLDSPPDLSATGMHVPPEFERLISRCLEKDPQRRFPAARDITLQLRALISAPAAAAPSRGIDSIAVLPFSNTGCDPDAEYLCEGIAENILNGLAQHGQIRVTPRSTAFRYKTSDLDPQAIGRELNVRTVVAGRVMLRGENLIVGAELIDVAAGNQLWGERYNRKLSDIFALEEDIARKISESLRMKISGEGRKPAGRRLTENTEAYQLYLRGRHHWLKRTPDHLQKALQYFQQAIETDPAYATAYSGLADCYSILAFYCILPAKQAWARAKAAAVSALAFDEDSAEAHTSMGFIRAFFDFDWQGADRDFRRAVELNPSLWVTPYWYSFVLVSQARFAEAEEQTRRALTIDPLSPAVRLAAEYVAVFAGHTATAIEHGLAGLEVAPDHPNLRQFLGLAYLCAGRPVEAVHEIEQARAIAGTTMPHGHLALAYAQTGNRAAAAEVLNELSRRAERGPVDLYSVALSHLALGDEEAAVECVERALENRGGIFSFCLKCDPLCDSLRAHPRVQEILRKMNLA